MLPEGPGAQQIPALRIVNGAYPLGHCLCAIFAWCARTKYQQEHLYQYNQSMYYNNHHFYQARCLKKMKCGFATNQRIKGSDTRCPLIQKPYVSWSDHNHVALNAHASMEQLHSPASGIRTRNFGSFDPLANQVFSFTRMVELTSGLWKAVRPIFHPSNHLSSRSSLVLSCILISDAWAPTRQETSNSTNETSMSSFRARPWDPHHALLGSASGDCFMTGESSGLHLMRQSPWVLIFYLWAQHQRKHLCGEWNLNHKPMLSVMVYLGSASSLPMMGSHV